MPPSTASDGLPWVALPRVPRQDHNCNERRNPFSRDKWFLSLFKEVDILFNLEVLVKKKKTHSMSILVHATMPFEYRNES